MRIYEHRASLTTAAGSTSSLTLKVVGGLLQQFLIRADTASTVFRANLVDENSITRLSYGFHKGEMNETGLHFPMTGRYTVNITNASPDDTFQILLGVQE